LQCATSRDKNPDAEFVFARDGQHIGSFYKAWKSACKRATLEGFLFHDFLSALKFPCILRSQETLPKLL
jgi:hypothetical protein